MLVGCSGGGVTWGFGAGDDAGAPEATAPAPSSSASSRAPTTPIPAPTPDAAAPSPDAAPVDASSAPDAQDAAQAPEDAGVDASPDVAPPPPPPPPLCPGFDEYVVPPWSCLFVNGGYEVPAQPDGGAPNCGGAIAIPSPGCFNVDTTTSPIVLWLSDAGPSARRIFGDAGACPVCR